ncbi:MAG: nucleotidyltransferase domain-containing protein [Chloroflexi bacterium]|nr:nucleotidyltransferase domain-containing protein [Chloroflexota bacterium]
MDNLPSSIPAPKQALLTQITEALRPIPGIMAIVLGGSYARGTHHATSDLDIGLYYAEANPFAIADIKHVAGELAGSAAPVVTDFYEWGRWVNGGAWIQTPAGKVDFLYRNLDQVQRTLDEAQQGNFQHDYNQQPAYGFYSMIYLAETQICIPLSDPQGQIAALKRQVTTYPAKLKQKIIVDCLWSAEFTLLHAQSFAAVGDVYSTVGCLTRIAANLTQVLFALNETYFMSDKRAMDILATFAVLPAGYLESLTTILAQPGRTAEALGHTVVALEATWQSVVDLAQDSYQPKFKLKQ